MSAVLNMPLGAPWCTIRSVILEATQHPPVSQVVRSTTLVAHAPLVFVLLLCVVLPTARAQEESSQARLQYAPDRDYDLQHIAIDLTIDQEKRSFQGSVVNTLAPLRAGLRIIRFDCGENLSVTACEVGGQQAVFSQARDQLAITAPRLLPPGKPVAVRIRYFDSGKKDLPKFHWIKPTASDPGHIGFWTLGEPYFNRQWLPTWDYPNDLATTEMRVTVPADWYVVSNGILKANRLRADRKARTFDWRMDEPYATYLISLVAGPFDIKTDEWRGVKLMYVVPKGKGNRIDDIFGSTPDMLSFFSDTLGVKYPWTKYAQTVAYDYSGGQENVTATTLEAGDWGDKRNGFKTSVHGLAHELAHQWFGDLVTIRHWGEMWLKEGLADLFADIYQEHTRGRNTYDYAIDDRVQAYISESRQHKRSLATYLYADAGSMFDAHTYGKGEAVLHTLRRALGDEAFFAGLHHYLIKYRHQLVDSHDLCSAMTEATGINLEAFFDQWVYKPGHPILDYTWRWDEAEKKVVLTVRQTQNTKDGTPMYDLNPTVGLIGGTGMIQEKFRLNQAEQEIQFKSASKPDAVILDPDHAFLREIPTLHWMAEEWFPIFKYASNPVDREEAMNRILAGTPSDAMLREVGEGLRADKEQFPVFRDIERLGELKREDLRPLFREQMTHPSFDRSAQAIRALGRLQKDETDIRILRGLVNDHEPYIVVRAAVSTLGNWDAPSNRDIFQKATKQTSPNDSIRLVALDGLANADAAEGRLISESSAQAARTVMQFLSDRANGVQHSSVMVARLSATTDPKGNPAIAGLLKDLQSFVPLACDEMEAPGLEEGGEWIRRRCFYKLVTGLSEWYLQFSLTAEGKVASLRVYNASTWQMGLPR